MSKRMLIDASHEEETRVVIVDNGRVEDLDFESSSKKQLRGNVYLARVTRVEPSLQAAFIEYGGNRHGFLAFPEIHPDYYQIPYEDRLKLQEEEEEAAAEAEEDDEEDEVDENLDPDEDDAADENDAEVASEQVKVASTRRKRINRRKYKIQEVIKRGQVLLVQAVKEERGNKGAALTTYLSLAGRYSVLMPNTPRGGGISRKIASATDRKRLKTIVNGLDVPQGMGVIVRTAGAKRTKAEIKRDYDYLMKLWDDIKDTTMKSIAPALVHEEGSLVKRALRDLYTKDIDEVIIEGKDGYKGAKSFIKMLMPSHAKNVKEHKGKLPLFVEHGVEKQIEDSLDAVVQLKSGGYLVIHPTEALVSVDVNSGRSTKERNVERTALKTNLEAAEEVARQMRLRDLAGLIVIDFIDMDENKNNRAVEKKMKDVLAQDRARVQWGKISQFGLMEISRQRRRRSLLDASTSVCRHCDGIGRKRTVESSALKAIRAVEELAARGKASRVRLKVASDVAHYIVNEKRDLLVEVEKTFDVFTEVIGDDDMIRPDFDLDVLEKMKGGKDLIAEAEKERRKADKAADAAKAKAAKSKAKDDDEDEDDEDQVEDAKSSDDDDEDKPRRRRRGRRGGRGRRRKSEDTSEDSSDEDDTVEPTELVTPEDSTPDIPEETPSKAKSGRTRRKAPSKSKAKEEVEETEAEEAPKPARRSGRRKAPSRNKAAEAEAQGAEVSETEEEASEPKAKAKSSDSRRRKAPARKSAGDKATEDKPKRTRRKTTKPKEEPNVEAAVEQEGMPQPEEEAPKSRRKAPAKKKATAKAADADDKPKKKAPAKKKAAKADEAPSDEKKPASRRKAPARKKAPAKVKAKAKAEPKAEAPAEPEPEAKSKPSRPGRRKAPSRTDAARGAEISVEPKKRGFLDRFLKK